MDYMMLSDEVTFHGLHEWSKHIFEKLGWMVLSCRKNTNMSKRISYIISIDKYLSLASNKLLKLTGSQADDVKILINNVRLLRNDLPSMIGVNQSDIDSVMVITGGSKLVGGSRRSKK